MSDQLKQLQKEFDENQAVLDRTRPALAKAVQEMNALGKAIYELQPEDVARFAADRRRLNDAIELLGQIANYRVGRCDELQRRINDLTIIENRERADEYAAKVGAIMNRLPFLALNDPERKTLQAELDALQRS